MRGKGLCLRLFQISLTSSEYQSAVILRHSKINTHHHVICAKATLNFKITTFFLCAQNERLNIMSTAGSSSLPPAWPLITANNDQYLNQKCPDTLTLTNLKYQLVIEDRQIRVCHQTCLGILQETSKHNRNINEELFKWEMSEMDREERTTWYKIKRGYVPVFVGRNVKSVQSV